MPSDRRRGHFPALYRASLLIAPGTDALRIIFSALIEGLRDVPRTILDFPCGSDRVTRHFVPVFGQSRIFSAGQRLIPFDKQIIASGV
jgi:hypothetical protein